MKLRIGALLGILALSLPAFADTIELEPVKDNSMYSEADTSNGQGDRLFCGTTLLGNSRRGLLAFDLSSIPPGSIISQVSVSLYMVQTLAGGTSVGLHRVQADWGEGASQAAGGQGGGAAAEPGDCTWSHTFFPGEFWTTPGGDFEPAASATTVVSGIGPYEWSGTDALVLDVQGWVDAPATNFGWLVYGDEEIAPPTAKAFGARNQVDTTRRPKLIVDYTPISTGNPQFRRGDCNNDSGFDIADAVSGLGYLFSGLGPAACQDACDANDDGGFDIADMIYVLGALFTSGPAPLPPGTSTCGEDPTDTDPLGCASSTCP